MAVNSKGRDQAEAQFKKAQRAKEGEQALSDYEAEARAVREKTARLKLLRLAKEAAAKEAEVVQKPAAKRKKVSA